MIKKRVYDAPIVLPSNCFFLLNSNLSLVSCLPTIKETKSPPFIHSSFGLSIKNEVRISKGSNPIRTRDRRSQRHFQDQIAVGLHFLSFRPHVLDGPGRLIDPDNLGNLPARRLYAVFVALAISSKYRSTYRTRFW